MFRLLSILPIFGLTTAHICPTTSLYQYPDTPQGTWFETIAVRSNGDLLLTSLNHPGGLSTLSPFANPPTLRTVLGPADFTGVNSTIGMVETTKDVFYITGSNFSLEATLGVAPGTNALFRIDFRQPRRAESIDREDGNSPSAAPASGTPRVQHIRTFGPEVQFLNGLTKFNDSILLAADSGRGVIWAIDVRLGRNGKAWVAASDALMRPPPPPPGEDGGLAEGINGVRFRGEGPGGVAYFTNSQKRVFARIALDAEVRAPAPAERIAESVTQGGVKVQWDDFALDGRGNAWVATEQGNGVQRVNLRNGAVEVVAGNLNSTDLAEPTSAAFGRTEKDRDVLYVSTAGGLAYPVYVGGKPIRVGAQVVAVDTRKC